MKGRKFKLRKIFFILFAIYVIYTVGVQQIKIRKLSKQEAELMTKLECDKKEMVRLEKQVELLQKESYIEKVARDELGLVKPDEFIYKKCYNSK